jgi:hypothetical protein
LLVRTCVAFAAQWSSGKAIRQTLPGPTKTSVSSVESQIPSDAAGIDKNVACGGRMAERLMAEKWSLETDWPIFLPSTFLPPGTKSG